jgi:hypothetical protein
LDLDVDQVSVNEMKTLISLLSSALFQTDKFTVIDVSERDRILKEIEFSTSECTDESCQVEIGKLLAAEFVVVGRLGKIGKRYVISLKMLETSSSRTVSTADGTYTELEDILDDLPNVSGKLAGLKSDTPVAERPTEKEVPAPQPAAAKARATLTPNKVAALACAGGAAACAGIGGVLLAGGIGYLNGPAVAAFDSYMAEPQGSAAYDSLYQAYLSEFAVSRGKIVPAVALLGGTVALGGASLILFVLPNKKAAATPVAGPVLTPRGTGFLLGIRVSW